LTPEEQDEYTEWLAEDPSHREAMALYQWGWDEFDRLAGLQTTHHAHINPDLLAPGRDFAPKANPKPGLMVWLATLPLAAVVALTVYFFWPDTEPAGLEVKPALELIARIEQRVLDDGSRIEINRGAEVDVAYSADTRLVYLKKGEANFEVAKGQSRPFIVNVAGVNIRAMGTNFSVNLTDTGVNVLVTEGKVGIATATSPSDSVERPPESVVEMSQKAVVILRSEAPQVEVLTLSEPELEEANLWRPRLLDFDAAPLGEIVDAFNRSNPIQIVLGDSSLEMVSLSSSFWSDNVEGFVRLMESSFGMKAEWQGSREIVLRSSQ